MLQKSHFFVSLLLGFMMIARPVSAATLHWDAASDSDLAGYVVYCGHESGIYADTIDVGEVLEYSLSALETGQSYYLAVSAYDQWGNESAASTEVVFDNQATTGVDNDSDQMPREFGLQQNYPNPFNPSTTIQYSVKEIGNFELSVYNLRGQRICVLIDTEAPYQGMKGEAVWDGRDESGNEVASGVYFYRLRQGNETQTKQMTLIK